MTPLRKEKDERRANYEKRRDQRRRSVHSSDQEAKKEIPKLTSTPKKTKKPKAWLFICLLGTLKSMTQSIVHSVAQTKFNFEAE